MRPLVPASLLMILCGCSTPEERACAHTIELFEASSELPRFNDDRKSKVKRQRDCAESLRRLRIDIRPTEDQWYAYLWCVSEAPDINAQFQCLEPLAGDQTAAIKAGLGQDP